MTQMSVTRVLTQLKVLKEQIDDYFKTPRVLIAALQGKDEKPIGHGVSKETISGQMQSNYDGYLSLVNRQRILKSALLKSNAETLIQINNKTITVAEAIELKATLPYWIVLLNQMKTQYGQASQTVVKINSEMEQNIQKTIASMKEKEGEDTEARKGFIESFITFNKERMESKMHDHLGLEHKIKDLEAQINTVKTELDYVLSESNTKTLIEVHIE